MRHLAPAEAEGDFDLFALADEPLDALYLEVDVVVVGLRAESYLFQQDDLLVFPRLAVFLLLLVLEAPVVQQAADWWHRARSDLYQVKPPVPGKREGIGCLHDAQLLAILVDDSNLAYPNPFINPKLSADRSPPNVVRRARPA